MEIQYVASHCVLHHIVYYITLCTTSHCVLHHIVHYITLSTASLCVLHHTYCASYSVYCIIFCIMLIHTYIYRHIYIYIGPKKLLKPVLLLLYIYGFCYWLRSLTN